MRDGTRDKRPSKTALKDLCCLNLVLRVSHLTPGGGKMRDPGNEVVVFAGKGRFVLVHGAR